MTVQKEKKYTYYLSLGTNLGNKEQNLIDAYHFLNSIGEVTDKASNVVTKPWGFISDNVFLNTCCRFLSYKNPQALILHLKKYETKIGRVKTEFYTDRVIDLDILLCDDLIIDEKELVIPHPKLHLREFVLRPLNEIASDYTHPIFKTTIGLLFANLNNNEK